MEHAYAYEAGYRDGSIHYELEHCPACKNVADLQEALAENAKLRELVLCLLTCASDVIDCDKCPINGGPGVWDFEDFCDCLLDRVHEMRIELHTGCSGKSRRRSSNG